MKSRSIDRDKELNLQAIITENISGEEVAEEVVPAILLLCYKFLEVFLLEYNKNELDYFISLVNQSLHKDTDWSKDIISLAITHLNILTRFVKIKQDPSNYTSTYD